MTTTVRPKSVHDSTAGWAAYSHGSSFLSNGGFDASTAHRSGDLAIVAGMALKNQSDALETLKKLGLPTHRHWWLCKDIDEIIKRAEELQKLEATFPFEMDGAVVKVNDFEHVGACGHTF